MAISNWYYLKSLVFPSGTEITQITDATPAANLEPMQEFASGVPVPLFTGHAGGSPAIDFTTPQIKTLLNELGGDFVIDTSAGNLDLDFDKGVQHGYRAGANGRRFRCAQAMVYLLSIDATHNQRATARVRIVPTWDGSANPPMQPLAAVTPGGTSVAEEHFTLGPVELNAAQILGVLGWTFDLNPTVTPEGSDGEPYPTAVDMETIAPSLTVRTRSADIWDTVTADGLAIATSLTWVLRRRERGGINYADTDLQHVVFTAAKGTLGMDNTSGSLSNKSETQLRAIFESASAAVMPVIFDTAAALP